MIEIRSQPALDGERVDRVSRAASPGAASTQAPALLDEGDVRIDGAVVTQRSRSAARRRARCEFARRRLRRHRCPWPTPTVPFRVVHEDDDVLVIDKPAGRGRAPRGGQPRRHARATACWPATPNSRPSARPHRPGIVHRLDKGTSGLLVVARTATRTTISSSSSRPTRCTAATWRSPGARSRARRGVIDAPIGRSDRDPTKMVVSQSGREARTHYEVERAFTEPVNVSLLRCVLETGRTHQIRVHLAAIGHPVVGDDRYRGTRPGLDVGRPWLHAANLALRASRDRVRSSRFTSPLPDDLGRPCSIALRLSRGRPQSRVDSSGQSRSPWAMAAMSARVKESR